MDFNQESFGSLYFYWKTSILKNKLEALKK